MKKRAIITVSIFTMWILAGCNAAINPDEVLTQYLNALDKGNYPEAYNYISALDKAIKTAADYARKMQEHQLRCWLRLSGISGRLPSGK